MTQGFAQPPQPEPSTATVIETEQLFTVLNLVSTDIWPDAAAANVAQPSTPAKTRSAHFSPAAITPKMRSYRQL
ncbi:hypothetical protein MA5S0422_3013 [Mycobacteroides abscessus 5S-0422]|uniref:Uncharacterized protein n=1 Tax=Mycobacteroides abscessus subsp. bolletii 1513 TaxID=1299321 RepID=X8DQY7_9MYCO|nr:hypothetical protein MA5S0421_2334 [Mycobacteroides abscessus 5S-0421]EIU10811.1 hypothetical protein MA5S0304_2080 [Mycobacteroides abscessus 5S-0304]EIU13768.1 hypothetical protein MA5S0422_3013 [Mycobacteroides abscessus 5S-0422]EIU20024.1 hypothetical protein MA5S0708_5102 [Mycobacteroides abscessus 5S-0708]EIU26731.1 hypothetical protein MA5S0817_1626 [Mycobacteroides abscessus 5S-0817]EIU29943.1 hypothetical protein MA5S1212_4338 [Mycobacteroides abscessus 5S-1212]EIU42804.1 hypothet